MVQLLIIGLLTDDHGPAAVSSATFGRIRFSRRAMCQGGLPATRMSMCILFLAVLASGTESAHFFPALLVVLS